jgi:serine phosphatase RsbU (regulator of sigma subunit)
VTRYIPDIDPGLVRRVCALPSNDSLLAASLRRGKSVLGVVGVERVEQRALLSLPMQAIAGVERFDSGVSNLPALQSAATGRGVLNLDSRYGVVRRVPMVAEVDGALLPTLSLEMLRLGNGKGGFAVENGQRGVGGVRIGSLFVATQEDGSLWVRYGHRDRSRIVSASQVLDGSLDPKRVRGKHVLVGLSAPGASDMQITALGERVPRVEIHAQILESVHEGATLHRPHWALWLEGGLMLAVGLAIAWGFSKVKALVLLPVMLLIMGALWLAGLAAYSTAHLLFDVASPMSIFVGMFLFMVGDRLVREEMQRKSLLDSLAREQGQRKSLEDDLQVELDRSATALGEMEAAKRIQMGILPDVDVNFGKESRLEIAAVMEPAKLVGGDLYDCFMLDQHRAFFAIGDVCGKGIPSSLFMAISKTLCKSLVLREDPAKVDPGALMRQANMEISRDNPEMLFVTAFIAVLDLRTGELTYSNAGHDKPLVFSPGAEPTELAGSNGPPICFLAEYEYKTHRKQLKPGEFVCLFTDGVTEAFNPKEELYGRERLTAVVRDTDRYSSPKRVLGMIREGVRNFAAGAEPSDDLTVMVLRWTP